MKLRSLIHSVVAVCKLCLLLKRIIKLLFCSGRVSKYKISNTTRNCSYTAMAVRDLQAFAKEVQLSAEALPEPADERLCQQTAQRLHTAASAVSGISRMPVWRSPGYTGICKGGLAGSRLDTGGRPRRRAGGSCCAERGQLCAASGHWVTAAARRYLVTLAWLCASCAGVSGGELQLLAKCGGTPRAARKRAALKAAAGA